MAEVAFDTLSMARTLERDYDFNPKQAEGAATMFHRHLVGNVATKEDIARVQDDIARVQDYIVRVEQNMAANMATKVDLAEVRTEIADVRTELRTEIAEVRTEIARSSNRQIYVLGGLIGGLFAIDKILPLFGV